MSLLLFLLIGLLAGWIAGKVMHGRGFGLVGNLAVGVLGAVIGGVLFQALGVNPGDGIVGPLITSTVGAIVLLFVAGLVRRR
jgi:uncharacterized membrane protein YeaQ/YmgE (transglycosylase-associated protein family)